MTLLHADWTLVDGALQPDVVVRLGTDGRIDSVDHAAEITWAPGVQPVRLAGKALLPGFVNAHSHAFQRVLRGRTEHREPGRADDDFWSWRTAMYTAANRLTPEQIGAVTRFAYLEMLRAGYTHVAEFHYLHHNPDGTPYADPLELTRRVLAAASSTGIGITLLRVAYQRGGPDTPATPLQQRFLDPTPEVFARHLDASAALVRNGNRPVHVGVAAHSVRALDRDYLAALPAIAGDRPLHAHVSEQPKEIAQCLGEHGRRPVELLADLGFLGPRFVGVHATHIDDGEVALLGESGSIACICPTTERNLGDGLPPAGPLVAAGASLAIGSDSHAVIDPFAELAALENGERLRTGRRAVLIDRPGPGGVARQLFATSSASARACQLDAGAIAPGLRADLVAVDLDTPALAGVGVGAQAGPALLSALALAGTASLVTDTWVGGAHLVRDRVIDGWEEATREFAAIVAALDA